MTQAEMNARKVRILRTLMDENLSTVDLQYFENVRLFILEERKRKEGKKEERFPHNESKTNEPTAPYGWQDGVSYALDEVPPISETQANALKLRLSQFLLDEAKEEEELEELDIVDYTIRMGDKAPCRYTREELNARADRAEARFERGEGIPHEEIRRRIMAL
ncbi:hypothetical protein [Parabacteroides sp. PF5-6]|uniref:hypothetical protein n=1 Tax=Parabacteroides sp. PF5-6 TaxID=1742403 RepID=UPI00240665A6|nr:hypothetical protein [Parabacteroides sp. PF5-6]MDF9830201.1 hypothetical protein [Parabacteroides sp. PF5-6]